MNRHWNPSPSPLPAELRGEDRLQRALRLLRAGVPMRCARPKMMQDKLPSPMPLPAWERARVRAAGATRIAVCAALMWHTAAHGHGLVGDCNGDGAVTVDELITGTTISLERRPVSACRSFDRNGDDAVGVDELVTGVNTALGIPVQREAFVVATDFTAGSFGTIGLDAPRPVMPAMPARQIGSDAVARVFNGLVYVVNRIGADTVQVLDPAADFATRSQCSTGAGSNPNDIAFLNAGKAYVPLFGRATLLVVNPSARSDCTDFVLGSIDLSAYADADGIPDMSQIAVAGNRVYVSLQRLANFVPAAAGAIVEIDAATDQVVRVIELTGRNPFGQTQGLTVRKGAILVSTVGTFGTNDGGIERIDLASGQSQGFVITEQQIGGEVTDFVFTADDGGYAILSRPDFSNALVRFSLADGHASEPLATGSLSDIELNDRGELFLADRDLSRPGVRIWRSGDGVEVTAAPLSVTLPPFSIVFVP